MTAVSGAGEGPTEPLARDEAPPHPQALRVSVISGPDAGASLAIERGTYFVGKASECDLSLSDEAVSRRHLELSAHAGGALVKDLGSKNGSFLGGVQFQEIVAVPGTVLRIGRTDLRFALADQPELEPSRVDRFGDLVGTSVAMREVFTLLERLAQSEVPVLIVGETGTGKDLCAHAIHQHSARHKGPFVVCDLGSIQRSLIESELFGHVAGAFTGARADRVGAFVQASGGTVFLDELGELELEAQPRLLRALEQRRVKPVGAVDYRDVDVRPIAATNRDLGDECKAGRFRVDLYHRIAVVQVALPPLREHKEDIRCLVDHFRGSHHVDADTMAILEAYDWPGNVRELRNVIDRGLALVRPGEMLTPDLLGIDVRPTPSDARLESFHQAKARLIAEWEQAYLAQLLKQAGGNVSRAARDAQLHRPHLYRLMKKHGMDYR
jgi:DNA-binding NtrC family response regulator